MWNVSDLPSIIILRKDNKEKLHRFSATKKVLANPASKICPRSSGIFVNIS